MCNLIFFSPPESILAEEFLTNRETYEREARKYTAQAAGQSLDDLEKVNGGLLVPQNHITCGVYKDIQWCDIVLFLSLCFILKKLVDSVQFQFVPQHLLCPLSKKMFVDPVKTVYGTVYERKAIEEHIKQWVNLLMTLTESELYLWQWLQTQF